MNTETLILLSADITFSGSTRGLLRGRTQLQPSLERAKQFPNFDSTLEGSCLPTPERNGRLTGHRIQSAELAWRTIHVTDGLVYLRGSTTQGRCAKRWQESRSTREGMCTFGCSERQGPFTRGAIEAAGKPDLSENPTTSLLDFPVFCPRICPVTP